MKFLSDGRLLIGSNKAPNVVIQHNDARWSSEALGKPSRMHSAWDVAANMSKAVLTTTRYQGDAWLMKVSRK